MILYDHSDEEARFLYERARFVVYSAFRAFELEVDDRFDDARQEAVLTLWDLYRKRGNEEYAFVGAKYAVMNFLRGKSPYGCLSLDADHDDYDSPWEERLVVEDDHDGWDESDWLSDADLNGVVADLFTIPATRQALDDYRRLLRHQMAGHTLQETAEVLGKTYDATKALRRRLLLKLAEHYNVAPTWEGVVPKLEAEEDFDGVVLAISETLPPARTVEYNAAVLRLLLRGYDNAAIAVELGRTEGGIKCTRRDLKRHLTTHCRSLGIKPPEYNGNGGGWRPAHHYANHNGRPGKQA